MNMKKTAFKTLALIFTVLTLLGSLYVLLQRGQVSPGYAVIPMLFAILFIQLSHSVPLPLTEMRGVVHLQQHIILRDGIVIHGSDAGVIYYNLRFFRMVSH